MTKTQTPLPLRNDTILGVCEALGQDFGVNPIYFRLAFIAPLFVAPLPTFAAYMAIGAVVAATRWKFKDTPASEQDVDAKAVELAGDEQLAIAA